MEVENMFKRWVTVSLILIGSLALLGGAGITQAQADKLVIYTYDSFVSWGPAKFIEEEFERRTGIDVQFVATGASREMLARLIAERDAGGTPADVFLGEINDVPKAKKFDLFLPLCACDIPLFREIPEALKFDPDNTLIPYEHGFITLVYDSEKLLDEDLPRTFTELIDPKYKGKLIVEDPRTSSVGHAFLLWTIANYGEKFLDYWEQLLPNILVITKGWSEAYDLFQKGEAPLVVSFSTDTIFNSRYKVLLLNNQGYRTIFGMGIVKGTDNLELAKEFLNFMLSVEVQEKLPTTEYMFPANPNALLPIRFYQLAVVPPKPMMLPLDKVAENDDRWLEEWARLVVTGR